MQKPHLPMGSTEGVEVLTPDISSRQVVPTAKLSALVEQGYRLIEPTNLPITHPHDEIGVGTADTKAEEPKDEPGDGTEVPTSSAFSAKEAIGVIKSIEDADTLADFVVDEYRITVLSASSDRKAELSAV